MDSKLLQQLVRSIQDKVRCPVCGIRYPESAVMFRGRLNSFFLFQLLCPQCQNNVFASVMVNGGGLLPKADIFLETPQKEQIQVKDQKKSSIKADEVIEFARFIEKNKTSISDWLR